MPRRRRRSFGDLVLLLRGMAEEYCAAFDHMPPVRFALGDGARFERERIQALYTRGRRLVEFSPGLVGMCWMEKSGIWDGERARKVLLHELVHAWVDATGRWSDEAGGHNVWFLWKAHQVGLALPATLHRWPELLPLFEGVKLGWEPADMPFAEWQELVAAARALDPSRAESAELVASGEALARAEARLGPDAWRRTLASLARCNPSAGDYRVVLDIAAQAPCHRWHLIKRALRRWSEPFDEQELASGLKYVPAGLRRETVRKWCRAALIMEGWEALTAGRVEEEFASVASKLCACADAVRRCGPLQRLVARLKARFDGEGAGHFLNRLESDCWDEEALPYYSELNRLCFQRDEPDIYEFFRLVLAR